MMGWNRRVEIDQSKWTGQNRGVQIDRSKYMGPKRWGQEIGSNLKLKKDNKKMSQKLIRHQNWYVIKTEILPKTKMSPKLICHKNWNVTKSEMSFGWALEALELFWDTASPPSQKFCLFFKDPTSFAEI